MAYTAPNWDTSTFEHCGLASTPESTIEGSSSNTGWSSKAKTSTTCTNVKITPFNISNTDHAYAGLGKDPYGTWDSIEYSFYFLRS